MPTTVNPTPESARTPQVVKDCTILQLGKVSIQRRHLMDMRPI
jgi:hypothetical protein